MDTSNDLPTITALQIIQIPEPSSALLFVGGCCGLGLLRRSNGSHKR